MYKQLSLFLSFSLSVNIFISMKFYRLLSLLKMKIANKQHLFSNSLKYREISFCLFFISHLLYYSLRLCFFRVQLCSATQQKYNLFLPFIPFFHAFGRCCRDSFAAESFEYFPITCSLLLRNFLDGYSESRYSLAAKHCKVVTAVRQNFVIS